MCSGVAMQYGIGITTRNRPEYLALALKHFAGFGGREHIFVYDDASTEPDANADICAEYGVSYAYGSERKGVAKAKNECLRALRENEHIFLFDDDCFPKKHGWQQCFITAARHTHVHHLMHIVPFSHITQIDELGPLAAFDGCSGVCLYVDKMCLNAVGGFDERFGIYGHEHAQYSQRAFLAKMSAYPYMSPKNCGEFIYSLDINYGWKNEIPPLGKVSKLYSSVTQEEAKKHEEYLYLLKDFDLKVPL